MVLYFSKNVWLHCCSGKENMLRILIENIYWASYADSSLAWLKPSTISHVVPARGRQQKNLHQIYKLLNQSYPLQCGECRNPEVQCQSEETSTVLYSLLHSPSPPATSSSSQPQLTAPNLYRTFQRRGEGATGWGGTLSAQPNQPGGRWIVLRDGATWPGLFCHWQPQHGWWYSGGLQSRGRWSSSSRCTHWMMTGHVTWATTTGSV